ncbi:hypothetical protein L195_g042993, partial [Trifolium pratense]
AAVTTADRFHVKNIIGTKSATPRLIVMLTITLS